MDGYRFSPEKREPSIRGSYTSTANRWRSPMYGYATTGSTRPSRSGWMSITRWATTVTWRGTTTSMAAGSATISSGSYFYEKVGQADHPVGRPRGAGLLGLDRSLSQPGESDSQAAWGVGADGVVLLQRRPDGQGLERSEERRVGKECRTRVGP